MKVPICPVCSNQRGGLAPVLQRGAPSEGDFSLCLYCGAMLRFTRNLSLRLAADDELKEFKEKQPKLFHVLITASNVFARRKTARV
jgi:hypothetical protein